MRLLMIDNYDSFTYNLVQYFGMLGCDVIVRRNDKTSIEDIRELNPDCIVISPGPCTPAEAGISVQVIREFHKSLPILGVCLGHQSIGVAFGGRIIKAKKLMHGKTSEIYHTGEGIFENIPNPFTAVRYHSLVIDGSTLPEALKVTAWTEDREIMAVQHKEYPTFGIQFHPESVLSQQGMELLRNFLKIAGSYANV